jgi:hypothetical protein
MTKHDKRRRIGADLKLFYARHKVDTVMNGYMMSSADGLKSTGHKL